MSTPTEATYAITFTPDGKRVGSVNLDGERINIALSSDDLSSLSIDEALKWLEQKQVNAENAGRMKTVSHCGHLSAFVNSLRAFQYP